MMTKSDANVHAEKELVSNLQLKTNYYNGIKIQESSLKINITPYGGNFIS